MTAPERDWRPFYADEAAAYDASRYGGRYGRLFEQLHHEALRSLARPYVPGPALEIAAGTGHTTTLLAAMGFDLSAVDLTLAMLARGKAALADRQLTARFALASAFALPFDDATFRLVVATRFLHLWAEPDQRRILAEMCRVLRPGGAILVDFDNWSHRMLLSGPIRLYQLIRRKRRDVGEHYNQIRRTAAMAAAVGLRVLTVRGVGGYHLVVPALLSPRLGVMLGRAHGPAPLRALAEQFVLLAQKP